MSLSNFTLALFTLILSAFFGSATGQDYYDQLLPQDDTSVASTAGQGDNYLASFLIANNSDSGTSSQINFKRSDVMRRMNTPERGSGKPKEIVVPLTMGPSDTRYVGTVRVGKDEFQKTFKVAFGTAAFDLAVLSGPISPVSIIEKSRKGSKHRYAEVLSGSTRVNLFDGFGTGVACRDRVEVGGISQELQIIATLQKIEGISQHSGIFPLVRMNYNQLPFMIKQAVEDQDSTKSFIKQAVEDHIIEPVFAFAHRHLSRPSPGKGPKGQGELHLGMIKGDYISKEGVEYHDCVANSPFWMIDGATITVGKYKVKNVRTVFDTASRLIRGPEEEVVKIYKSIQKMTFARTQNGLFLASYSNFALNAPSITIQWGHGKPWEIPSRRFVQGTAPAREGGYRTLSVGIFAVHTEFTAKRPAIEPPLLPHAMGPPTHLEKVPIPHPVVDEPQDEEMYSDDDDDEKSANKGKLPGITMWQPMPEYSTWIIPYPLMEERYMIFDGRNGGCKIGIATLPEQLKFRVLTS